MEIADILANRIEPFEIEDEKLKKLFSYFLHLAPTIDSKSAHAVPSLGLDDAWNRFLSDDAVGTESYHFYSVGYMKSDQLRRYSLLGNDLVKKRCTRFMCYYKSKDERELECLLRHLRNAIAHSNVYLLSNRRKCILFDDFNRNGHQTARILFSQTDLQKLKKHLEK